MDVADEKNGYTGWKYPNPGESLRMSLRMWARSYEFGCEFGQLCKFGCECRRGDKSLRMSANARNVANVATNVGNVASPTNVGNFASICDKKASADACGCLAAVLSFCVPPGMKKAGNFPAFLSFPLKL